jgi:hypothetical protein
MSPTRIVALIAVFALACAGWVTLGTATAIRSELSSGRLTGSVESLWGSNLVQQAPLFAVRSGDEERPLMPDASTVRVGLQRDYRHKGLVWYPTFVCTFAGSYRIANASDAPRSVRVHFDFPAQGTTYDDFAFTVDEQGALAPVDTVKGIDQEISLAPGQARTVRIAYRTRGLGLWRYQPGSHAGRVHNLDLVVTTNFQEVDYADGSLSPMAPAQPSEDGKGLAMSWSTSDLITTQDIAVRIPEPLNPGPVAARITFFAPVCLFFFYILIAAIAVVRGIDIHPMHYLFVAAGFFAFHLLLAYLVDVVDIHLAFLISATTTVVLVTSYLRAALDRRFPAAVAIGGQAFFLVLFSYSFFLTGLTGLTVAVGSVLTLAVLMALTAKLDWNRVFAPRPRRGLPATDPQPA